jgi:hypothetical protein
MSPPSSSRDDGLDGASAAALTAADEDEAMTMRKVDDDEVQIQGKRKRTTSITMALC